MKARGGRPDAKRRPAGGGVCPKLGGERTQFSYEISASEAIPGPILLTHWVRSETEALMADPHLIVIKREPSEFEIRNLTGEA